MLSMNACLSKNKKLPWRIIEDEAILVDVDEGEVVHLNPVGAEIWNVLDGKKTVSEIINYIYNTFEVKKEIAKKDTLEFLEKLLKKKIVIEKG